jgi:hypothetical protein
MADDDLTPVTDDLFFTPTIRGFVEGQNLATRYTLLRIVGRGGMGVIWLARDLKLDREVALKFLPDTVSLDKEAISDLKRETRRSLDLTHPNIVRIYDFVEDITWAGISMEFVAGDTFSALKVAQPNRAFEVEQLGQWVRQLCGALTYAHEEAHIVHRDLKPANLMLDGRQRLKIADFGIARSISDSVSRVSVRPNSSGTLAFMSPQQARGQAPGVSDDIYSLGATLYDLIAGKPPFYTGEIYQQLLHEIPESMAERRKQLGIAGNPIPECWEQTVAACLAKEPAQRPQSAGEVAERFGLTPATISLRPSQLAVSEPPVGSPSKNRTSVLIAVAVLGVAILGCLGYYLEAKVRAGNKGQEIIAKQSDDVVKKDAPDQPEAVPKAKVETDTTKSEDAAAREERNHEVTAAPASAPVPAETVQAAIVNGSLTVSTNPPEARIAMGSEDPQTSPASFKDIKPGTYALHITLDGYEPLDQQVEIKSNQTLDLGTINLARSKGGIEIGGDTPGLFYTIKQDGTILKSGKTPATVSDLFVGSYDVSVKRGYQEANTKVEVQRNQTTAYSPTFSSSLGGTTWAGSYSYPSLSQGPTVEFTITNLTQVGSRIRGRVSEAHSNFGPNESYLTSTISGTVSGSTVSFTKTYDFDGHQAIYRGNVDLDEGTMAGTWHIGTLEGAFRVHITSSQ